ncbi:MAG TPA: acylphosphatase [Chloroflexota bacterium]|nr:acylphosphatase [Chloroflexota bacterium]
MDQVRAHLYISGRVQGVGFRESTRRQAEMLGVTGWVRNTTDGRVEAVIEGEDSEVRRMVEWCRRGPAGAWVDRLDVNWETGTGEFDSFEVRLGYSW